MTGIVLTPHDFETASRALAADDQAVGLLAGEFGQPFLQKHCVPMLAQQLAQRLIHLSGQHSI
ncbi:MAG: hypothetical protein AB7P76_02780 [Candidatus Melainabacteria bacterium]